MWWDRCDRVISHLALPTDERWDHIGPTRSSQCHAASVVVRGKTELQNILKLRLGIVALTGWLLGCWWWALLKLRRSPCLSWQVRKCVSWPLLGSRVWVCQVSWQRFCSCMTGALFMLLYGIKKTSKSVYRSFCYCEACEALFFLGPIVDPWPYILDCTRYTSCDDISFPTSPSVQSSQCLSKAMYCRMFSKCSDTSRGQLPAV